MQDRDERVVIAELAQRIETLEQALTDVQQKVSLLQAELQAIGRLT